MKLHELSPTRPRQARKRRGRGEGGGHGGTSGRGNKGQKSRSGFSQRPHFEGGQIPLIRRLPKRGFTSHRHINYAIVNLGRLDKAFAAGEDVNVVTLTERGLIRRLQDGLKILAKGELTKALKVTAHAFSAGAKAKIEAVGGTCTVGAPPAAAPAAPATAGN